MMIRNLKVFGLAVVAMLAMTAVVASAASAAVEFNSEAATTNLTGTQTEQNVLTVTGGTVKCNVATFAGTQSGTTKSELEVEPKYSGCTAFGQASHIDTNGCKYKMTAAGKVSISCGAGGPIVVTVGTPTVFCTVKVGAHTPANNDVDYTNEGAGKTRDILVRATAGKIPLTANEGITYTSSGGICGASGSNGAYRGTVTTTGYSDPAHLVQVGIWRE
jgi:hypothetical protein